MISLGPGCFLYKRDLKKAYRQFLGYTWDNQLYFNTILTMGLLSAAIACKRSTSAVSWISSRQKGRSLFNNLDDFIGVSPPHTAATDFQPLEDLLTTLELQESSSLRSSRFRFLQAERGKRARAGNENDCYAASKSLAKNLVCLRL